MPHRPGDSWVSYNLYNSSKMPTKESILVRSKKSNIHNVPSVENIDELDLALKNHYSKVLIKNMDLNRSIVSFQSNKKSSFHRWYKYKEAFSSDLVKYLFDKYKPNGTIFDPFAGIGTTLFTSADCGLNSEGIELLPIGQFIISTREKIQYKLKPKEITQIKNWIETKPWNAFNKEYKLNELKITKGAYSSKTKNSLERYMSFSSSLRGRMKEVAIFALLCVLESISYTRKDGQYLRWDYRSGRRPGENDFNKGSILEFDKAIAQKLFSIVEDKVELRKQGSLFDDFKQEKQKIGQILLHKGSCLSILPTLKSNSYAFSITSPPYCNRYDYTRTYALELALLGFDESQVIKLRQEMLSCTVENREKDLGIFSPSWVFPVNLCEKKRFIEFHNFIFIRSKTIGEVE